MTQQDDCGGLPYCIVAIRSGIVVTGNGVILTFRDFRNKAVGYAVKQGHTTFSSIHELDSYIGGPISEAATKLGASAFEITEVNGRLVLK